MQAQSKTIISVKTKVHAAIEKIWKNWTTPADIICWNTASADWHTLRAENDLKAGGSFSYRMEARDGSMGFDFWGTYDKVIAHKLIEYTLGDGRKVKIVFSVLGNDTEIVEDFESEDTHSRSRRALTPRAGGKVERVVS